MKLSSYKNRKEKGLGVGGFLKPEVAEEENR